MSYGTITFYQKVLSAVFNMAVDEEYIARNPTARALDQIEGSQQKRESLTIEQEEALLRYAKKYNYSLYRKLVFLIDTMCRIGEFTGITWNDIDMKEKMISINHQLQYKKYLNEDHCRYRIAPTKGKEVRYIPMTQRLYKILKEMRTYYFITRTDIEVDGVKDFVFLSNNGKLVYGDAFRQELIRLLKGYNKDARYKIEHLTPHMLRHTGCTRNAENGMDLKVLQYLMGHKSSKITNDVYNHVTQERAVKEVLKTAKNQQKQA